MPKKNPHPVTAEERFMIAAQRIVAAHGGRPTASIEQGRIVFTYPDGTRTSGGSTVSR